jgi:hypothetical protein
MSTGGSPHDADFVGHQCTKKKQKKNERGQEQPWYMQQLQMRTHSYLPRTFVHSVAHHGAEPPRVHHQLWHILPSQSRVSCVQMTSEAPTRHSPSKPNSQRSTCTQASLPGSAGNMHRLRNSIQHDGVVALEAPRRSVAALHNDGVLPTLHQATLAQILHRTFFAWSLPAAVSCAACEGVSQLTQPARCTACQASTK